MQPGIQQVAVFDDRPFFDKTLIYGVRNQIIDQAKINSILNEAPKGMVQIAEFFGTQYLRPNIEDARMRIVNLVSLRLEHGSGGDLEKAAHALRDNSLLSLSRGGSEMLKNLWVMPEDTSYGLLVRQSQKEFLADWSMRSLGEYRQALKERQGHQLAISTALWFAEGLSLAASAISTVAVESIIRTGLLVCLSGKRPAEVPNASGLIAIFDTIRRKGVPAKGRKQIKATFTALPEACLPVASRELQRLEADDLPRILDTSKPMNHLIQELEPLYYLRDFGTEDASLFDTAVSADWQRITAGKTDDNSLLTIFVCLATDAPAKPVLRKSAARALIRRARLDGFKRQPVLTFIRSCAPHEMQDDLEALWVDFFAEAEAVLLDATDPTLSDALAFLKENCIVI